ncbi:MAG TPA: C25 family cysteine peptidase [Thermoanaerobaculales bacterium]|nr:C25 family cysteine peptidase [Thermoanaerobaculales bacterium]
MGRKLLVTAVCVLVVGVVGAAEPRWIAFSDDMNEAGVEILSSSANGIEFMVELPGIALSSAATDGGQFVRVEVPGLGRIGAVGEPELPALRRFVEIPDGAQVEIDVNVIESRVIDLAAEGMAVPVEPVQMPRPKCDCEEARNWRFSYSPEAYRGTIAHPTALTGPFTFRDHRMMLLALAPVRYDVDRGRLEVTTRAQVSLRFTGGDLAATVDRKERLASRHYDAFLGKATVNLNMNLEGANWAYPDDAPVEFLIITPPQFVTALEPFVEWKTSCGYHVTVTTTDVAGTTTSAIKSYLTGLYNGATPPVYILMIGDSPSPLPTYTNSGGGYGGTDLPYVQMDADLYADMMIARWPIDDTTELANVRDKILWYEQPTAGNSAWLNRALFLGGDDYMGWYPTHEDVIAQLMAPPPNSAECALWYGDTQNPTTQQLINDLNTGRGWAVYSAHSGPDGWSGDPPLSSGDMPNFGNTDMYPVSHGHSCSSNEWNNYGDVFGEAAVIQPSKGFVAYWGASNSSYWDGDDWLERGFFDAMFDTDMTGNMIPLDRQYSNLAACYAGLTEVTLQGGDEQYYWYLYNLNGDPTLDPFTRQPIALDVGAPPVVPPTAIADFEVTVSDGAIGPVPLALVGVSQDGVLLGAGMTDATGTAIFPIEAPTAGSDMTVRVTAHNHLPTDATVIVAAGSDGVVTLDRSIYRCDSTVGIDVFDEDLAGHGTQSVTLSAQPSGGSTTVILSEVGGPVVRFSGSAVLGSALSVADGDTLTVTYYDQNTGGGSGQNKTDTAILDCAGPLISDVELEATEASVTVRFTTDEPGTTVVHYGTTRPPQLAVSDPALRTQHEIVIEGVDPCTYYFVGVESADALGNVGVDTNGGSYYGIETMGWQVFLSEPFDADPGWTIDNGGNSHGWAFGQPTGGGGQYGEPDPTSGHTGTNVYGVNLVGDYDPNLTADQLKLTTPSLDLSEATSVMLRYWRWLGVESPSYDHARVQVSVDGGAFVTVWENTDTIDGGSWVEEVVDVTAQAAGHADVRIRWTMGPTDSSWQFAGWNLDDVVIEGAFPCDGSPMPFVDGFESGDCSAWSLMVP